MVVINPASSVGVEAYQAQLSSSVSSNRDVQRQEFRPSNENDRSGENAIGRDEDQRGEAVSVTLSFEARTSLENPQSNFSDQAQARARDQQDFATQQREAAINGGSQNQAGDASLQSAVGAQTEVRQLGLDGAPAVGGLVEQSSEDVAVARAQEAQSEQNAADVRADTRAIEDQRAEEQASNAVADQSGGRAIPPGSQVNLVV